MHTPALVEEVVKSVADQMHSYTQMGGGRPFGVNLMYAGFDKVRGFQLYNSDPSGNYAAWNAHATGKNSPSTISTLKDEYNKDIGLTDAIIHAIKLLAKTMDGAKPSAEKFEIGVVHRNADGGVVQRSIQGAELDKLIVDGKIAEAIADAKK